MRVQKDRHNHHRTLCCSHIILALLCFPSPLFSQLSRLNLDLSYTFSKFSMSQAAFSVREQRHDQLYTVDVSGYTLDPNLMCFSVQSGFRDHFLKSFGPNAGNLHSRSLDLYNFNVDLFCRSPIPITVYGSRNSQTQSYAYSSASGSTAYETISEMLGFSAMLRGNSFYPNLRMGWNRSSTEGTSPLNPYDRRSNNFQLSMNNSDEEQISSYSIDYQSTGSMYTLNKYVRLTDPANVYIQPPRRESTLSANARTTVWEDVMIAVDFNHRRQDNITNRVVCLNLMFHTSPEFGHTSSLRQITSYGFGSSTNSYNFVHSVSVKGSARSSGNLRGEFTRIQTNFGQSSNVYQRFSGGGSWTASSSIRGIGDLQATAGGSLGQEGYTGRSTLLIYSLMGNATLVSQLSGWLRSSLSEDISTQRYLLGRTFTNKVQFSLQADPGLSTNLRTEVSQSNSLFLDQVYLPQLSVTAGCVTATTSLVPLMSISVSYKVALYRSAFRNVCSSVSFSIVHRGLVRNLAFSANGDFTNSTYPAVETVKLSAGFTYQLFAYTLTGSYLFDRFAAFRNQGFYLGIQRQFSFDFQ